MKMNNALTLGSLFDGSGGFPLGGLLAGITPLWASEIEPFPISVTTKRLPFMFDTACVQRMACDHSFFDLVVFLEDHKAEYVRFILTGEA